MHLTSTLRLHDQRLERNSLGNVELRALGALPFEIDWEIICSNGTKLYARKERRRVITDPSGVGNARFRLISARGCGRKGRQKESEGGRRLYWRQPPNNECEGRSFFGSTGAKTHVKGKRKRAKVEDSLETDAGDTQSKRKRRSEGEAKEADAVRMPLESRRSVCCAE